MSGIAIVVIGRNEGVRLHQCLDSVRAQSSCVVYVDSGSTDGSVEAACARGATVVELDMSVPFTAARARNVGFQRVLAESPEVQAVQFVDGDCEIAPGWLSTAAALITQRPEVGVVCGRVRERAPEASIYNRVCDLEWNVPAGEVAACGGIALIRARPLQDIGGFNASLIAGEEPEMCHRMRQAGHKVLRIETLMCFHDARMSRFAHWWRRMIRSGYGGLDVATRSGADAFRHEIRSARVWGLAWPLACAVLAVLAYQLAGWGGATLAFAALFSLGILQVLRISRRGRQRGLSRRDALTYGFIIMASKFAQCLGQARYAWHRLRGRSGRIIEYKVALPARTAAESEPPRASTPASPLG